MKRFEIAIDCDGRKFVDAQPLGVKSRFWFTIEEVREMNCLADEIEAEKENTKRRKLAFAWDIECPKCNAGYTLTPYRNLDNKLHERQSLAAMEVLKRWNSRGDIEIKYFNKDLDLCKMTIGENQIVDWLSKY